MKVIVLISLVFAIFIVFSSANDKSENNTVKSAKPENSIIWVHSHTNWWGWWWEKNCSGNLPKPPFGSFGVLNTLTFKHHGKEFEPSMEELKIVTNEERAAGFKVMPNFHISIKTGYEKGKEFQSWFDRDAWVERAQWLEGMLPYAHDNKLAIDLEPYWKSSKGNRRYPNNSHKEKLAYAIKPFIDVVKKHKITLYVMPGGLVYTWVQIAVSMGADLVMLDEESYRLPDYYQSDSGAYRKKLKRIAEKKREIEAAGMRYIPGFFETALKKPGFLEAMAALGYEETWVFIRRTLEVHRFHKFCLPEFYDLGPYNFK